MMVAGDLKSYIDYFRIWADAHPDLKFFMFGSVEKGLEFARSFPDFNYPFAWLEQPVVMPGNNGAGFFVNSYHTGLSVLLKAKLDNNQDQIDAYAKSLAILTDLQAKLIKDHKAAKLQFDVNTMKIESINQLWVDGHFGFRLELVLELRVNSSSFK